MNRRNYQRELEQVLMKASGKEPAPTLFLHSCCAPCSSYVLEYLSRYFRITVFYYNPNISPESEYGERVREQRRLIEELNRKYAGESEKQPEKAADPPLDETDRGDMRFPISFQEGDYRPEDFYDAVKGLEKEPEGGARCTVCFHLRLFEAARLAKRGGFDYFATTLTISPLKDAERLNQIGEEAGAAYGVKFLNSDFKKKNGYRRSVELSREYGLYRQDYCGCVFSRRPQA